MCLIRVKPGFIGRQGSSDRSFYVTFTALPTDTCLESSYPFVLATNLLSDTAVKICIARVITLCSHWIKASSEKTRLVLKGFLQNGAEKKNIEIRHRSTLTSCPGFFYTKFVTEIDFYMKEILDEDKSVCSIHLYPSIVQINRAKKLSDEPLKFPPSIFLRMGSSDSKVQLKLEITSPPIFLFFIQTRGYIYVLMLPFNIQVLIFVVFE